MALSPNAGKDEYLLEKSTCIVHYLKSETENCKILQVGPARSTLVCSYSEAEQLAIIKYGKLITPCPYCCKK